jgi:P27 family predicted phage terminase small subunit
MGSRGPKPTPQALRVLRHAGATPRRPMRDLGADPPAMPDGLSAAEQAAWARLLGELSAVPGLVCRADRGLIEIVARMEPQLRAAWDVVRDKGATVEIRDKSGHLLSVRARPEATSGLKIAALLKTAYSELGLTPAGRSRVSVAPAPAASKLDAYLQGRHGA